MSEGENGEIKRAGQKPGKRLLAAAAARKSAVGARRWVAAVKKLVAAAKRLVAAPKRLVAAENGALVVVRPKSAAELISAEDGVRRVAKTNHFLFSTKN